LNFCTDKVIHVSFVVLSIGGHAKTLMFVHINPELNAIGETISTLKFAERVASIELGAAQSNKETGEIRELKEEVQTSVINCANLNLINPTNKDNCFFSLSDIKSQTGVGEKRNRAGAVESWECSKHFRVSKTKSCFTLPFAQIWHQW